MNREAIFYVMIALSLRLPRGKFYVCSDFDCSGSFGNMNIQLRLLKVSNVL